METLLRESQLLLVNNHRGLLLVWFLLRKYNRLDPSSDMKLLYATIPTFLILTFSVCGQITFTPLGGLPGSGYNAQSREISGDGSTIIGYGVNADGQVRSFKWTEPQGYKDLGFLSGGNGNSYATGVSYDGTEVVGYSNFNYGSVNYGYFRGETNQMDLIGSLEDSMVPVGITDDGNFVAGSTGNRAMGWTAGNGLFDLGNLGGPASFAVASALSGNGKVVGRSFSSYGQEAFIWSESGGMVGLGDLSGGIFQSQASAISADGETVAGLSTSDFGNESFIWTNENGMIGLGNFGISEISESLTFITDISGNGSILVGQGRNDPRSGDFVPFLWTETTEGMTLESLLFSNGVSGFSEWNLQSIYAISDDGSKVVGSGINPDGVLESFLVSGISISVVPEPSTVVGMALSAGLVFLFGRKRNACAAPK